MEEKYCSRCGRSLKSFFDTAMLGCPECYKSFREEVISALKKIQGRTFHVGKKPAVSGIDRQLLSEYRRLLAEQERAGLERRFEDMARISEDVSAITEELKNRGLIK